MLNGLAGRMRRLLYPLLAVIVACTSSLATIQVEQSARTTVEAGTLLEDLLGDIGFEEFVSMDLTEASELQNQGVAPGDIQEVYLRELSLTVTSPDGGDLSFLDSMEVYVEGPDLPRQLVAWQDEFPEGQGLVEFELEGVDLTDYVVSESMTLSTEVSAHRPEETTEIKGYIAVDVGVTAQGACNQAKASR